MHAHTPRRLIVFTRSKVSAGSSAASSGGIMIPALLKAMSRRPKVDMVRATSAATSSSSDTSQTTPCAVLPSADMCSVAAWSALSSMSASTTDAPVWANARAVASPIPELAPVTRAT
jgi:phage-related tail fiber protein